MNKSGYSLLIILILGILSGIGNPSRAFARKKPKVPQVQTTGITSYEKLFKDRKYKSAEGLFKLHLLDEKLYMEIPVDLLNRELLISTTIEESSSADYGLTGQQPIVPYHITFSRKDSVIRLHEVPRSVCYDQEKNIRQALKINSLQPIVATYPIQAYSPDSSAVVIDCTPLFTADNKHLKAFEPYGMTPLHVSEANYKAELSLLYDIDGGENYSSVFSDLTYYVTTRYFIFVVRKDVPFTVRARRTITLLPQKQARKRIADPRIGVIPVPFTRFSATQGSRPAYYASRIDFHKTGSAKPITIHIDSLFDSSWHKGIQQGITLWNQAFRHIGMGDMLHVSGFEEEEFDANAPNTFSVKYVASANPRIIVNVNTDPRSGEITGGRIHLPTALENEIRTRRFLDLSAVDPQARDMQLNEAELIESIAIHTARGVAQLLGLATNYAAASAYPTDSLRSATFTRQYGICSSITSPNSYNYLAQAEDSKVRLANNCLGTYDYFAIQWLYAEIPDIRTPQEEKLILDKLLLQKAGNPYYYYGNYWYDYYFGDVRLAYTNLGDDPVKRCKYRFRNLKYIAAHADEWLQDKDKDFIYRNEAIDAIASGVKEMISYLAAYIGGTYYTEIAENDGQSMLRVVPKEKQQLALKETLRYIKDLSWLDTPLTQKKLMNLTQSIQDDCINTLFKRLETLMRYQKGLPEAYTPQEMCDDLMQCLFNEIRTGRKISEHSRRLQQAFLAVVIEKSGVKAEAKGSHAPTEAFASTLSRPFAPVFPQETAATHEAIQAYDKYRVLYYDKDFAGHIYYSLLVKIGDIYRQGALTVQDADSRTFCKYMHDKIHRMIRTE